MAAAPDRAAPRGRPPRAAARALVAAVRRRDPAIAGLRATPTTVDGAGAVRLDARERIAGGPGG